MPTDPEPESDLCAVVDKFADEIIETRRDLHAHPELSWGEVRTTRIVRNRISEAGWRIRPLTRTGFVAELGSGGPLVALRADLDALPVQDTTTDPWRSTVPGVAHACGHDVHTASLMGAALALAEVDLPGRVRLVFQPAEEVMPGGAKDALANGALDGVQRVFALHCDPSLDVGQIGLREGPLTGAADQLEVRLVGHGGHTSRPHLTEDLIFALGKLITELPAILSRRLDPRAGVSVVWGVVRAGAAANVIPDHGVVTGTVRMLDAVAWTDAERLVRSFVADIVAPYGVVAEVDYRRGVPPVLNERASVAVLRRAATGVVGSTGVVPVAQSLGGEDFGWFVEGVPGAMARLGTRSPGGPVYDLHQGDLRIDEGATVVGAKFLATAAVEALITGR